MSEKRRDNRGRILHTGEVQLSTGQYRYKYVDNYGDERYCYSWRLDHNDRMPVGKKHTESLREMEKKIEADQFDHIAACSCIVDHFLRNLLDPCCFHIIRRYVCIHYSIG